MKTISRFLKWIDFSKVSYGFHIHGHESYTTKLGGSLYIILMCFTLYYAIVEGYEFLIRKNFSLIAVENNLPSPPKIDLDMYTMNFGFRIIDSNDNTLSKEVFDKYFVNEFKYITKINSVKDVKYLSFAQCTEEDFINTYNKEDIFIKDKEYLEFFCVNKTNLALSGSYNDESFSYIQYSLYLNSDLLKKENKDSLEEYFKNNKLKILFKYYDYSIDIQNYKDPIRSFQNDVLDYINFNMIKKYNLDFCLFEFTDDKNIFFNEKSFEKYSVLYSSSDYFFLTFDRNPNLKNYNLLNRFYIRSTFFYILKKRVYKKFPVYLSSVSGISTNVLFIILLFNKFYNKFRSKEELINLLLKFKENFNKEESINTTIKKLNNVFQEKYQIKKRNQNRIHDSLYLHKGHHKNFLNEPERNKSIEINRIDLSFGNFSVKRESNNNIISVLKNSDEVNNLNSKNGYKLINLKVNDFRSDNKPNNLIEFKDLNATFNEQISIVKGKKSVHDRNTSNDFDINSYLKKKKLDDSSCFTKFQKKINNSHNDIFNKFSSNIFQLEKDLCLEENENEEKKNIKVAESRDNSVSPPTNTHLRSRTLHENALGENIKRKLFMINGKPIIFNFSIIDIFFKFCLVKCSKKKRTEFNLYSKALSFINNQLNIYFYLKVIQELDLIKTALFSKDEMKILNFVAKPIILEEEKNDYAISEDALKNNIIYEKNLEEVVLAYEKTLKKKDIKESSKNLLKILHDELRNIVNDPETVQEIDLCKI